MSQARAIVPTAHASRYLQQLCKHWAHKFAVEFTPEHGQIDLGDDRLVILDADAEKLTTTVKTSAENLDRLQDVVGLGPRDCRPAHENGDQPALHGMNRRYTALICASLMSCSAGS